MKSLNYKKHCVGSYYILASSCWSASLSPLPDGYLSTPPIIRKTLIHRCLFCWARCIYINMSCCNRMNRCRIYRVDCRQNKWMENTTSLPYGANHYLHHLRFCSRNDWERLLGFNIFQRFSEYIRWIRTCVSRSPAPRTRSEYLSMGIPPSYETFEKYHKTQKSKVCTMGWGTHIPSSMWFYTGYDALCNRIRESMAGRTRNGGICPRNLPGTLHARAWNRVYKRQTQGHDPVHCITPSSIRGIHGDEWMEYYPGFESPFSSESNRGQRY